MGASIQQLSAGRRPLPRGRPRGGFTLIEVLVTLVILSTGIVAVLRAFQSSASALGAAHDATVAAHVAELKLADLRTPGGLESGHGAAPEPYGSYWWEARVEDAGDVSPNLARVTLAVGREQSRAILTRTVYEMRPP